MSNKPNILLITTDQQRFDTIAALGNHHIYTPHLDWLVDNPMNREFYGEYSDAFYCIIRDEYKYTWAKAGGEDLLFNLKLDPMEQHNLAEDAESVDVLNIMQKTLIQNMTTYNSTCVFEGRLKPGPSITAPQDVKKRPGYHLSIVDFDVLH